MLKSNSEVTEGFWGPIDAQIDWCEPDYASFFFVAEPLNTITNASYIVLAIFTYRQHKHLLQTKELIFCMSFVIVGLASFAFHGTLRYVGQIADEIAMIWVSSSLAFCFASLYQESFPKTLAMVLICWVLLMTALLLYTCQESYRHTQFHNIIRGFGTATFVLGFLYCAKRTIELTKKDSEVKLRRYSTRIWVVALFSWVLDVLCCPELHSLPIYINTHALGWHTCTALGTYMCFLIYLMTQHSSKTVVVFNWIPYLERLGYEKVLDVES